MKQLVIVLLVACGGSPKSPPKPVEKPAPACTAVADHMLVLIEPKDAHARKIRETFALHCEQDKWSAEARTCVVETTSLDEPRGCKQKLAPPQREALERDLAALERERVKAPTSCERYKHRIEQLMTCEKLPQASRDALKQGYDAMSQGWENVESLPEEARKALDDGCKQGTEALESAVKDLCGW